MSQPTVHGEDADIAGVRLRIRRGTGLSNYSKLARATGCNAETVRRYMTTGVPNLAFIKAVCQSWNLSANWVLFGVGPKHDLYSTSHVIREIEAEVTPGDCGRVGPGDRRGRARVATDPSACPKDRPARGPIVLHPHSHPPRVTVARA